MLKFRKRRRTLWYSRCHYNSILSFHFSILAFHLQGRRATWSRYNCSEQSHTFRMWDLTLSSHHHWAAGRTWWIFKKLMREVKSKVDNAQYHRYSWHLDTEKCDQPRIASLELKLIGSYSFTIFCCMANVWTLHQQSFPISVPQGLTIIQRRPRYRIPTRRWDIQLQR